MPELLDFKGKVDFTQAKKDLADFEKQLAKLGVAPAGGGVAKQFDVKPLTEYQAGQLKIKQQAADLAKQKYEDSKADKAASLAIQAALKEEIRIKKEQIALEKQLAAEQAKIRKVPGTIFTATDKNAQFQNSTVRMDSSINGETVARAQLNTELAKQAVLNRDLVMAGTNANRTTVQAVQATKQIVLSKQQLAKLLAEEKYIQQQATAELKNNAREMLNAKGSLEQRRAALIRLQKAYDQLSASERVSPAGQRLEGVVKGVSTQVLALERNTNRAGRNVGNYLTKAWGGLKMIANILPGMGIAGLLAFAIDPLMNYLKTLDMFKGKIDPLKDAQSDLSKKIGESGAAAAKAGVEVSDMRQKFQQARDGVISKESALKSYNDGIGKTLGFTNDLNEAEARTIKNGDAFVELMFKKAKAAALMSLYTEEMSKAAIELAKSDEEAGSFILSGTKGKGLKNAKGEDTFEANAKRNRDNAAKVFQDKGKVFKELYLKTNEEIAVFAKNNQLTIEEGKTLSTDSAINAAVAFSEKLTKLHRDSSRKQMDSDDAEIQSVIDKYKAFKEEADKFYATGNNAVVKLNGMNISKDQVFGTLKADEQAEKDAIVAKRQAEIKKKEEKATEEHYTKLLSEFADYGQKMDKLKADFEADDLLLIKDPRQRAIRKEAYDKDVQDLVNTNSKKLDEYEKLFNGIDQLSEKSALKQLEFARRQLDKDIVSGKIVDPKEIEKIKGYFNQIEKKIKEGSGKALKELGAEVMNVANEIGAVNEGMGRFLNSLGSAISRVGDIKKGLKDFGDFGAKGDSLGQLTAGLGIIGAGFSIFSTITKMFDRSAEREAEASYSRDLQNKQTESLNKALERQVALLDKVYGTEKVEKYNEAVKQANANADEYAAQLVGKLQLTDSRNKYIDAVIEKINRGEKLSFDEKNIKSNSERNGLLKTLPQDIAALQKLMDEGKLDAGTELILNNLIKAKETAEELANSLSADNVGSSLSQIADDFIATLTDGTQDFGKSFEETIRTSILNGFKGELIRKQLQAFYDQFADLSSGGLTKEEIEILRTSYTTAAEKAKQDILDLEKATGIKLGPDSNTDKPDDPKTGISGKIVGEALKEDTANRMLGMQQGQYDIAKQTGLTMGEMLQIGRSKLAALERIANSNDAIEGHTARLANIETALSSIDKKTSGTTTSLDQALRDAGIGG